MTLSPELLQAFFARSADALFVVESADPGSTGTIVACNDAACELYGYERERFLGLPLTALSAEHGASATGDALERARQAGRLRIETTQYRANGTSLAVDLTLVSLPSSGRQLVLVTAHDITHHWHTERRLAAQHAVSRILTEADHFMDAAPRMLQTLGEHLGWDHGLMWCVDYQAQVLRCTSTWRTSTAGEQFEAASRQMTFGSGIGLPGSVWADGEPTWLGDLRSFDNFPRSETAAQAGYQSAFVFPILGHAGIFGILEFFSRESRPPDATLLEMARAIGSQCGQYIERRRAETAVRASDARKGAILQAALDAIITIDHQSRITEFNPAAERIFGYRYEEVAGRDMAEMLIPSRFREQHRRGLARYLTTGASSLIGQRVEISALRADGSEFPVELAITRIPSDGPPVFTGFVRDITARKQAEQRAEFLSEASTVLAASLDYEASLTTLVDLAVPRLADWCSINLIDAQGRFTRVASKHVDPAKELVLRRLCEHYPPELGRPVLAGGELIPDHATLIPDLTDDQLAHLAQYPEQVRTYREIGFGSALLVPLHASKRHLGLLLLLTGESGRRYGPEDLALAENLAGRAALAIDNARLYREAQVAVQLRDEFLSVAAHELKTPVTALVGYAQLLQRRTAQTANERDRRALDTLAAQSERLAHLVATLLDISRIQLGTFVLERRRLELCTLIRQAVEEFQTGLPGGALHSLEFRCPEQPLIIDGDAMRLGQVLRNLIQNGIKYSPEGGPITLALHQEGERAIIAVRDRGIGIPPDARASLFQRFYRAPNIAKSNISGMGIGLYVVHEIVSRHGGTIEVESTEGEGSTFSIRLPLASASPAGDAEASI